MMVCSFLVPGLLAALSLGSPLARQEPEYYDGYEFLTPDTFSVDIMHPAGDRLNVSTAFGGALHDFACVSSQHTDPTNQSQWLVFPSPSVPGSNEPVLQSNITLFPGANLCEGRISCEDGFDGTLLGYDGEQVNVTNSDDCQRWSGEGGDVSATGPVLRCVLPLTSA